MKLIRAGRFAALVFATTVLYALLVLTTPLQVEGLWTLRQEWLMANPLQWMAGGWLALLAIFAWMVLLVALMYSYLPAHRIATMLQSGLLIISAVLLIGGVIVWMNLLPRAADADWAAFVDGLALTFLGAGLFMGGGVTAWIALDLGRLQLLPWTWTLPGIGAGLLMLPSPFVLPNPILILPALALFFLWTLIFGMRRRVPSAYPEMVGA
jgi:hypothetical protein